MSSEDCSLQWIGVCPNVTERLHWSPVSTIGIKLPAPLGCVWIVLRFYTLSSSLLGQPSQIPEDTWNPFILNSVLGTLRGFHEAVVFRITLDCPFLHRNLFASLSQTVVLAGTEVEQHCSLPVLTVTGLRLLHPKWSIALTCSLFTFAKMPRVVV